MLQIISRDRADSYMSGLLEYSIQVTLSRGRITNYDSRWDLLLRLYTSVGSYYHVR